MRAVRLVLCLSTVWLVYALFALAQEFQQIPAPTTAVTVPRFIRITGVVRDAAGAPLTGSVGITFALYKDASDQEAVWQETQTVSLDLTGHYAVQLGSSSGSGLPMEIFTLGQARWLGVHPDGQSEQPRILLLSVAYALKAADADMLGGMPASAFLLAANQAVPAQPNSADPVGSVNRRNGLQIAASGTLPSISPATSCNITSDGTASINQLAKFTTACNVQNSAIFESGGNVGIGNKTPAGALDVSGTAVVRGQLLALGGAIMSPTGTASTTQAYISNPLDLSASAFNTALTRAANYIFRWQAEPKGNDSTNTGATLNLLYGVAGDISETGLSIAKNGIFTFAPGQTFPGIGAGTVTSVATGAGLTGGPITKSGTISIPAGGVTNKMLASPAITVNAGSGLSGGGAVALGGSITLTNAAPSLGGTVTSIASGTGLTGGPITASGTLSLDTSYTDRRYLRLSGGSLTGTLFGMTANFTGALKAATGTLTGTLTSAGVVMTNQGTASASRGFNSNPLDFLASSFNSSNSTAASLDFRWQAEAAGNNSSNPSATLNLLFGSNGSNPAETGLSVASNGRITFASGQTFPGTGPGTITQVSAGSGLAGGGSSGNVTLSLLKTCGTGQTLLWNGTTWTCGSFGVVSGTPNGMAYFVGPASVRSTAAPANGQILIGATGSAPALATLTAGPNITITNGPGSVQISAAGAGVLPYFATGSGQTGASVVATQNVAALWGFLLPYSVTTTEITYDVVKADKTTNAYDIGIFNNSGNLVLDVGAAAGTTFAPSSAFQTLAWRQGSRTLAPGRYYLALTTNCSSSCAAIGASSNYVSFAINASGGASAGGTLPSALTPPADTWGTGSQPMIVIR